ncbi:MAG: hypothetical protein ACXAC7_18680 [Candidatus Hodarchaeales archaeon]|jgi:hypothetical protein
MFKFKVINILILIFCSLFLINPSSSHFNFQIGQNDANSGSDAPDDLLQALSVDLDTHYSGQIGDNFTNADDEEDNHDYYQINLDATGNLSLGFVVTSTSITSLSYVSIIKDGYNVASEGYWEDDPWFDLIVPIAFDDIYYIKINSYSDFVEYDFEIKFYSGNIIEQVDAGTTGDASSSSPKTVNLDTTYTGLLGNGAIDSNGYLDDEDVYYVYLPSQGYIEVDSLINTPETTPDFRLVIKTIEGETIIFESSSLFDINIITQAPIGLAGDYIIIFESLNWNASYSFFLSFTTVILPSQNDTGAEGDASEIFEDSPFIGVNTTIIGTVGQGLLEVSDNARDNSDFYRLGSVNYGILNISLRFINSIDSFPTIYLGVKNNSDWFRSSYLSVYASSYSPLKAGGIELFPSSDYFLDLWTLDVNITYEVDIMYIELPYTPSTTTGTETTTPTTSTVTMTPTTTINSTTPTSSTGIATPITTEETSTTTETTSTATSILIGPVLLAFSLFVIYKKRQ